MLDPYGDALQTLIGLGADRALVLQGPAPLQVRHSHGFAEEQPWTDQVSLGLLERSLQGEPLLLADVRDTGWLERWSVEVTGIQSVVCVPFWSPSSRIVGILYADTLSLRNAFTRATMDAVQHCARKLERALYGGPPLPDPAIPVQAEETEPLEPARALEGHRLGLKRASRSAAPAQSGPTKARSPRVPRPRPASLVRFFRCLATLLAAGVPLVRSLQVLSRQAEDAALAGLCRELGARIETGVAVHLALEGYPHIFERFDCCLAEVGESAGALPDLLHQLADFREKLLQGNLRIVSALVYPCAVASLGLAFLTLGTPLLLRGQLQMLRATGQPMPLLTSAFLWLSDALSYPEIWALGSCILLVGTVSAMRAGRQPRSRRLWWARALRLPWLGRMLWNLSLARFAHGLGLLLGVGIPLPRALRLAARLTDNPELVESVPLALDGIDDGLTLAGSLERMQTLPPAFLQMVTAGEESGKLDRLLAWMGKLYELELENDLETVLSLIEPLLLLLLGVLVAAILLATLLPMVGVLNAL